MRGGRETPFTELGSFASLSDAAAEIQRIEKTDLGILFRVFVDPINPVGPQNDAEALSSLDYQTAKHYYALERNAH